VFVQQVPSRLKAETSLELSYALVDTFTIGERCAAAELLSECRSRVGRSRLRQEGAHRQA
jgi:hypothetical protein